MEKNMENFYRLVEHNDNEGETWLYYFKADSEIVSALEIITSMADEEYEFDAENILDEEDVDFIVDQLEGIGGYKSLANKVTINPKKYNDILKLSNVIKNDELDEDDIYE